MGICRGMTGKHLDTNRRQRDRTKPIQPIWLDYSHSSANLSQPSSNSPPQPTAINQLPERN